MLKILFILTFSIITMAGEAAPPATPSPKTPPFARFQYLLKKPLTLETVAEIIASAPELRQYKALAFTDFTAREFFYTLGEKLIIDAGNARNSNYFYREACLTARDELSDDIGLVEYQIPRQPAPPGTPSPCWIENACTADGQLYLLLSGSAAHGNATSYAVAQLDTDAISIISAWTPPGKRYYRNGKYQPFAVYGDMAVIAGPEEIFILPLNGRPVIRCGKLPVNPIMDLTIMNQRIYAFLGREKSIHSSPPLAVETILFSCRIDGSDRRIVFSTLRNAKENDFDRLPPFSVHAILPDPAQKRLILACRSAQAENAVIGIWEFYPDTATGKCRFANINPFNRIDIRDDRMYFTSNNNWEQMKFDPKTDRIELLSSTHNRAAPFYLPVTDGFYNCGDSVFSRPGQLWMVDNYMVKLLTFPEVAASPLFFVTAHQVFPHPDGRSAWAVDMRNVYKITPPAPAPK